MARFGRPNSPAYASLQTVALGASIVAVKARRRKTSRRRVAAEKGERTGFASFRLDAGEFDDLAPLLGLVGDQLTEAGSGGATVNIHELPRRMNRLVFWRRSRAVCAAAPSGYLTYIKSARPHAAIEWGSLGSFCHAAQIAHSGSMSGWRRSCPTIRGRGASDDRHDQSHLRGLSGDVAKTGPHILGVDERILQPETGLRLGGSRRLCAKYRQYEAVVHILSHRVRHDGAQMGDREAKSVSAMPVSKKLYLPTVAACVALLAAPTI